MRSLLVLAACVLAGVPSAGATAQTPAAAKHWQLAKDYLERGMRRHAEEEAKVVLKLAPHHSGAKALLKAHAPQAPLAGPVQPPEASSMEPASLLTESQRAYRASRVVDARRLAEEVLRTDPGNAKAARIVTSLQEEVYQPTPLEINELLHDLFERAMVLYRKEEWKAAAAGFQKALATSPTHDQSRTFFNRARLSAEERSVTEGLAQAREAIAANRPREAKVALRHVLEVQPDHPEAVALMISLGGDPREAERRARAKVHFNRGVSAYEQGRWTDATREWELVTALYPDDHEALRLLRKARGKAAAARRAAKKRIPGLHAGALRLYQQGKLEEASTLYNEILELDPGDLKARQSLKLIADQSVVR